MISATCDLAAELMADGSVLILRLMKTSVNIWPTQERLCIKPSQHFVRHNGRTRRSRLMWLRSWT